ncbi:MAG: uracil-DNA glycosylase [Bifidobacteriaceae bacterium]|jgi:uracil-DNA glycosylase|nr:uracil-DNA glycosylase [Bifidobacteriaceae bacterium]
MDSIDYLEGVDARWQRALEPVRDKINALMQSLNYINEPYLPLNNNVFRAFSYPFNDVKVLIVGQDPYPNPEYAMGLSFSVPQSVYPLPKSLQNMFLELRNDIGTPISRNGDLSRWSAQGVMLMNRVLTVYPGRANSHRNVGWEQVTAAATGALIQRRTANGAQKPLVIILWGNNAKELLPVIKTYNANTQSSNIYVIESAHPSPLSANRGFFGSKPFSRTNAFLTHCSEVPINW